MNLIKWFETRPGTTAVAVLLVLFLIVLVVGFAPTAQAEPIGVGAHEGVELTLTNEVCEIPAFAEKYPGKVIRKEKDVRTEGCYDYDKVSRYVTAWFPRPGLTMFMWSIDSFTPVRSM